jgi:hypothetical protein
MNAADRAVRTEAVTGSRCTSSGGAGTGGRWNVEGAPRARTRTGTGGAVEPFRSRRFDERAAQPGVQGSTKYNEESAAIKEAFSRFISAKDEIDSQLRSSDYETEQVHQRFPFEVDALR